jgi:xanthine/CO dehydrogenase XdhC/CoxF family maturation factor
MAWGLGLGCNGIVRVLVEPLAPESLYVAALRRSCATGADAASSSVATVYQHTPLPSAHAAGRVEIGSRLLVGEDGEVLCEKLDGGPARLIEADVRASAREGSSGVRVYELEGRAFKVFFETLAPPVPLVIFGAGQDALPVVELARGLGWQTEVVDPQARSASRARFASADALTLARPEEVAARVRVTPRTLALLMTHNYSQDLALLKFLLASPARYVGVMGPRKRTERMLSELAEADAAFRLEESDRSRLHAPAGLDIGANAPAEIALSIIAEMRAVLEGRGGGMLRERGGSIHGRLSDGEGVPVLETDARPVAAA